jgi:hypothetical protein
VWAETAETETLFRYTGAPSYLCPVPRRGSDLVLLTPDEIARALQAYTCCYENPRGEIEGIGFIRVEEMEDDTTVFVFVSDSVQMIENEENGSRT